MLIEENFNSNGASTEFWTFYMMQLFIERSISNGILVIMMRTLCTVPNI